MSANRQCQGLQTQCQDTAASGNPGKAIRRIVKQDGLRRQDEAGGPNQTLHTNREQARGRVSNIGRWVSLLKR